MAATNYILTGQAAATLSSFSSGTPVTSRRLPSLGTYQVDLGRNIKRFRIKLGDLVQLMKDTTGTSKVFEQNDAFAIIPINKGEAIEWAALAVISADTNAITLTVGDTGSTAGYITSVTANATGITVTDASAANLTVATTPAVVGKPCKVYTADDAIVLKLTSATLPATNTVDCTTFVEVAVKYLPIFPDAKLLGLTGRL